MKPIKMYVRKASGNLHPFPVNLEMTARKKIQGVFTYLIILDHASYLHFAKGPNAYQELEDRLRSVGFSNGINDESWNDFKIYMEDKPSPIIQQVILNIVFAWDRYLNEIRRFILAGNDALSVSPSSKDKKTIERMHLISFDVVLECLTKIIGETEITQREIGSIKEITLLRNLGVHNDWIVDSEYLRKTKTKDVHEGEVRDVCINEIIPLYADLLSGLRKFSNTISRFYCNFCDKEYE